MHQSFTNWECLLGVETSKDNTEAIAKEYVEKDPRFKISITPKTGSCSATRNIGIDTTSGEYVIFLDGDDYLVENSLQRLYDKISARPGADLYPCAVQVQNEVADDNEKLRDNYPQDFDKELTGKDAILFTHGFRRHPQPMMQLTICRRQFLLDHKLKCVYGLRGQDREFSPRALYWAKRVIPLHEPFYLYRKRIGSIVMSTAPVKKLHDQAIINKSLLAFHASVCKQPDFDKRLTICWGRSWTSWMFFGGSTRIVSR